MANICLIHTVVGLVPVFDGLLKKHLPGEKWSHVVDESLLKNTILEGKLTPQTRRRLLGHLWSAADGGADVLMVTCSSIGYGAEEARPFVSQPVLRIDEGMADEAVSSGSRIGVLATLSTTLDPTSALIHARSLAMDRKVEILPRLVDGAFEALSKGDTATHDARVAAELTNLARDVDVIVLAQASMARIASGMVEGTINIPVLSSPELGIKRLSSVLGA